MKTFILILSLAFLGGCASLKDVLTSDPDSINKIESAFEDFRLKAKERYTAAKESKKAEIKAKIEAAKQKIEKAKADLINDLAD